MWHLGAPLLNPKPEKCPMRIGQSLELAALSHDEKTSLWNQNAGFGPFGEPQVMDRGDRRAHSSFWAGPRLGAMMVGSGRSFVTTSRAPNCSGCWRSGHPAVWPSNGLFEKFASQYIFDGRSRDSGPGITSWMRPIGMAS